MAYCSYRKLLPHMILSRLAAYESGPALYDLGNVGFHYRYLKQRSIVRAIMSLSPWGKLLPVARNPGRWGYYFSKYKHSLARELRRTFSRWTLCFVFLWLGSVGYKWRNKLRRGSFVTLDWTTCVRRRNIVHLICNWMMCCQLGYSPVYGIFVSATKPFCQCTIFITRDMIFPHTVIKSNEQFKPQHCLFF